jgi:hypothetical protein
MVFENLSVNSEVNRFFGAMPAGVRKSCAFPESLHPMLRGYAAAFVRPEERRHSRRKASSGNRKGKAFPHIGGRSPKNFPTLN